MTVDRQQLENLRIDRPAETSERRAPFWIAGGIALVLVIAVVAWLMMPSKPKVVVAAAVQNSPASSSTVLNASGYITARRQATVSSKMTGRVTEVMVEEGMRVERGQVLARLDSAIPAAATRLSEAQVAASSSALEETRVRISEAKIDLDRAQRLATEAVASRADFDRAEAQHKALQARLVAQGDQLWVAKRELQLRMQDLEDSTIRAPFSGIVVSKNAQPGEMISPISAGGGFTRTGICTIVDMESLEIEVDVNEAYINRVRTGQKVSATLDAYPGWSIPAHVITVVPAADRQKATVRVRIAIDTRDPRILPDMGVKVSFIETDQSAATQTVSVPRSAVKRDNEKDLVYVVSDGKLERRAVRVASADAKNANLASGVAAGEQVVVASEGELRDGAAVRITKEQR